MVETPTTIDHTQWGFAKYPLHLPCYEGLDFIVVSDPNTVYIKFALDPNEKANHINSIKFKLEDLQRVEPTAMEYLKTPFERITLELERAKGLYSWEGITPQQAVLNLAEECGEVVRALNNLTEGKGSKAELETELIQTGAMVLRCFEVLR